MEILMENKKDNKDHLDETEPTNFMCDENNRLLQIDGSNCVAVVWTDETEKKAIQRTIVGLLRPVGMFSITTARDILFHRRSSNLLKRNLDAKAIELLFELYNSVSKCEDALKLVKEYLVQDLPPRIPQKSGSSFWRTLSRKYPLCSVICCRTPARIEVPDTTVDVDRPFKFRAQAFDSNDELCNLPSGLLGQVSLVRNLERHKVLSDSAGGELIISGSLTIPGEYYLYLIGWSSSRMIIAPSPIRCIGEPPREAGHPIEQILMKSANFRPELASLAASTLVSAFSALRFDRTLEGTREFSTWECGIIPSTLSKRAKAADQSFHWWPQKVQELRQAYASLAEYLSFHRQKDERVRLIDDAYSLGYFSLGARRVAPRVHGANRAPVQPGAPKVIRDYSSAELVSALLGIIIAASGGEPPAILERQKEWAWQGQIAERNIKIDTVLVSGKQAKNNRGMEAQLRSFEIDRILLDWIKFLHESREKSRR
eukprot:TRINITY_DN2213_c0_g1_i1.p1 TRINITY_DN2213_c0_g1~~TRINITY_DN2213_c0_g1_i1.p1  ORF type:complete len:485 (-),score=64.70 TRINITY_DN2213_c0_g1_i1:164-1618(-)